MSKYTPILGPGRKCSLLISDMQRAYTEGIFDPEFAQDKEIAVIKKLIAIAHEYHIPVIYTIIAFNEYEILYPNIWVQKIPSLKQLAVDSTAAKLDPRFSFNPEIDYLVIKKNTSAFFGTPLASQLHSQRIDTVFVTGCTTSGCVRATAVEGMENGFRMMVIEDAVADRWPDFHMQSLCEIHAKYGDVIDSFAAIKLIQHMSRHP
jgi:maleamate amidohydrolase